LSLVGFAKAKPVRQKLLRFGRRGKPAFLACSNLRVQVAMDMARNWSEGRFAYFSIEHAV
jgi:hypothetical protein